MSRAPFDSSPPKGRSLAARASMTGPTRGGRSIRCLEGTGGATPLLLSPARRRLLVALVVPTSLGACGFELRRAPELRFQTIQLTGFRPRSPLADELRMNINASTTTKVVDALPQAQVVLNALADAREKSIVASSAAGQVTEFQLRERFSFQLRGVDGHDLIPPTEILLSRDMSYTESAALGKEQEENFLYTAMQHDIVSQVLRRLASVQTL